MEVFTFILVTNFEPRSVLFLSALDCWLLNNTNNRAVKWQEKGVGRSRLVLWGDKWHTSDINKFTLAPQRTLEWHQELRGHKRPMTRWHRALKQWAEKHSGGKGRVTKLPQRNPSNPSSPLRSHWVCQCFHQLWWNVELFGTHLLKHPHR